MRKNQQDKRQQHGAPGAGHRLRRRLEVGGTVQGVGFRPFVYRLATELGLAGLVGNDPQGAFIEVEGPTEVVEAFENRLQAEAPPLAQIANVLAADLPATGENEFRIVHSTTAGPQEANLTPDTAACGNCLRELFDPDDRRYRYPFINCTNCGPRYSIITAVPYDRPNTTMKVFPMCPACQVEYDDPADRRFHAQPNACPVCGPRAWLTDAAGTVLADADADPAAAVVACAALLRDGRIMAIKGLGGFHIACRADSDDAVALLRRRKERESKPLALMTASLEKARALVRLDDAGEQALTGIERPIVLAPRQPHAPISALVAPGTDSLGVMLPYTPLHALLLAEVGLPLVMTSGNPTDEPLCCDNDEALDRLSSLVDGFLLHDRPIERRIDDSVVMVMDEPATADAHTASKRADPCILPIRRARGFVPTPIELPWETPEPLLAVGGELKATVCLAHGRRAVISEHLGELPNARTFRNFLGTIERFSQLLRVEPTVVACDLHPAYATTRWAHGCGLPIEPVQHHHAHVAACMAEHALAGPVLGVATDGTGYGTDGATWGCELFVADALDARRVGHLRYTPVLGGDRAAVETWRPAAGWLHAAVGEAWRDAGRFEAARIGDEPLAIAHALLAGRGAGVCSSLGRLFDAAGFLLGLCDENSHEGQAPIALEAAARTIAADDAPDLPWRLTEEHDMLLLDPSEGMVQLGRVGLKGDAPAPWARAFHAMIAAMLCQAVTALAERTGIRQVALTGGCFVNRLLHGRLMVRLRAAGLQAYSHRLVPPGDGGLALGQTVVAAARLTEAR